ncbi:F17F16.3 protein [Hibiscus syriacus]|uniref:RING-type E3 ubiquitin transferase n=1 Tax=Hibiscus syriacus TaxID=106335 RepID=A0A6A3A8N8_HIBSY|nr:F17F16.3 protein [Hibiscus syriacus]
MWYPKGSTSTSMKKGGGNGLVAVAIDKDKGSQHAFRWAVEHLLSKSQTVVLIHVVNKSPNGASNGGDSSNKQLTDKISKELFLTFHCFCTRKDIHSLDVVLEDSDIVKALTEYVAYAAIEKLVLGAPSRSGFMRKFRADIPSCVSKASPDFCTVYVISKGKVSSVRNAVRAAPFTSPLLDQIKKSTTRSQGLSVSKPSLSNPGPGKAGLLPPTRASLTRAFADLSESDTDISFVSSDRPSTDCGSSLFFDSFIDSNRNMRLSNCTDISVGSMRSGMRWADCNSQFDFSQPSIDSGRSSCSSQNLDEVEAEMKRLRQELKQTMDLYGNACRQAISAKQQAIEIKHGKNQEEQRLEEVQRAEEAAMSAVEKEKAKCKAAMEAAEAVQKRVESKRILASTRGGALRETEEMKRMLQILSNSNIKYKRYSIEEIEKATENFAPNRKIGEGGYGPVFKCYLEHTQVAVKVLRPDAAQGRLQFLQEIEVLSSIRHPNMVLLLGACPEYGILVYEYMARGSLDDCLFGKGNSPVLSWQLRFRIAADIATGLLFLHQTKPEPIVHRDMKPANILLDHNYVSKISDVGLAKLVPAVAENVTQCCITSAAGTFCYIDPEYQQTGVLGVKSDVYSLGIILLQLLTARPPMGLSHYVGLAIENGTFEEMLDPAVTDWPAEETLSMAKLAIRCAELRRRDRPDLDKEVLPELNRLKEIAEENMPPSCSAGSEETSTTHD